MDSTSLTSSSAPRAASLPAPMHRQNDMLVRLYGPVLEQMEKVEQLLTRELQSRYESVALLLRHGTQLGGKRLRPALLMLSASAVGKLGEHHVILGAVVEMVHTATLIHDDVLDDAATRRHAPTVNAQWNNHTSILLGDYLFAQSFRLAATLPTNVACQWIGESARQVCEGELRQVLQRDELEMDEDTYFEIIRGKTAELCRVACALGGRYSGANESEIVNLGRYGESLGIAFQIADDFLDLWGDDEATGKTLGTDIEQGKITLPIIRLLATSNASERERIVEILRGPIEERVERIRPCLDRSDAKEYTQMAAFRFRDLAIAVLESLPSSDAKQSLHQIAAFSVSRPF